MRFEYYIIAEILAHKYQKLNFSATCDTRVETKPFSHENSTKFWYEILGP